METHILVTFGLSCSNSLLIYCCRAMVALDCDASLFLGRPCAIHVDEYVDFVLLNVAHPACSSSIDVEFPIECDDEYWEHPDPRKAFRQPSGKPSYMSFFISALKLSRIVATCLRTLVRDSHRYSPNIL